MASLRRNTNPVNDTATAKFLYTILKQLDHKSIDWNLVASELEITNGHAARMRFSRFKQHMEGIQPGTRKPKPAEPHNVRKAKQNQRKKTGKATKGKKVDEMADDDGAGDSTIDESQDGVKAEPTVKQEPLDTNMEAISQMDGLEISGGYDGAADFEGHDYMYGVSSNDDGDFYDGFVKAEPFVKEETF